MRRRSQENGIVDPVDYLEDALRDLAKAVRNFEEAAKYSASDEQKFLYVMNTFIEIENDIERIIIEEWSEAGI